MYLVEIKLGDYKIQKYVINSEMLERLISENPQYEYVKVLKEISSEEITKPKVRRKKK